MAHWDLGDVCFYFIIVSEIRVAGIRGAFDYWSKHLTLRHFTSESPSNAFARTLSKHIFAVRCMFTEVCHLELVIERTQRPRYSLGLTGAVVTNLEMVARPISHSPS